MDSNYESEGVKAVTLAEHNADAGAKRVVQRQQGTDGEWYNAPAPLVDVAYDYQAFSNPDGSGNYQTIQFKSGGPGGTVVRTLSVSYDGNNNVTSIERT